MAPTTTAVTSRVHARRLRAQMLSGPPAPDPLAVTRQLFAIQGQDPRGARLAIRARSTRVTAADIDLELTERRSLVITWLNRGTLHLVASEDYPLLQALTAPTLRTSSTTRLAQEGVDAWMTERGLAVIAKALADDGPSTRHELRLALERAGLPTAGQALIHLLFRAAIEGIVVRGPMAGRQHAYVLVEDWLGPQPRIDRDRAVAELARRYLTGHGPATDADLSRWAGLPLRDARAGLAAIGSELATGPDGLVDLAKRPRGAGTGATRLLGAFEPLLLGWCSRADVLGEHASAVVTGGIFRGFALVGGRAAALWRVAGGAIELEPLEELAPGEVAALARDGEAVLSFLGLG